MASLSPSDVLFGSIITHLVVASRNGLEQPCNPINVLCFLADHVGQSGVTQFATVQEMSACFDKTVHADYGLRNICLDLRVEAVDDFISKLETIRTTIESSKNFNHNNLAAPSMITPESHLGIFLRTILAKWECFQFEDVCSLHHRVQVFLADETPHVTSDATTSVPGPFHRLHSHVDYEAHTAMSSTDPMISSLEGGDVAVYEELLHRAFDLGSASSSGSLLPSSEAKESSNGSANTRSALEALVKSAGSCFASGQKHQHAMLRLAAMWLQAGNLTMALSAIEEALKTAHQRGDHRAVSQALLLLYSVFQHSGDPELVASAEDILLRCNCRSAALDMQHLTAQSALLLASVRSKQALSSGIDTAADGSVNNDRASGADSAVWAVRDIWSQLSFALLGEISLTRQVATKEGIVEDSEFTQSGPTTSLLPSASQSAAKKVNLQEVPLAVGPELLQLSLQACLVASELWERQGMLHMAEFACRRGLLQFAQVAPLRDTLPLYVRLIYLQADLERALDAPDKYAAVLAFTKSVRSLFRTGGGAPAAAAPAGEGVEAVCMLPAELEGATLYVLALRAWALGDSSKALRLAARLVDMSAASPSSAGAGREHVRLSCSTEENIRAKLLLAEVMGEADCSSSLQLLSVLEAECKQAGHLLWLCYCQYARGKVMLQNCGGDAAVKSVAVRILVDCLQEARCKNIGLVAHLISNVLGLHLDVLTNT